MKFTSFVLCTVVGTTAAFVPSKFQLNARTAVFSTIEEGTEVKAEDVPVAPVPLESTTVLNGSLEILSESIASTMEVAMPMAAAPERVRIQPGRYNDRENSIAIPFIKRPPALDGSHAGDYGFDPLGFTEEYDLYTMQEAEIRHARLAMLAVVGWPLSELVAPDWMLQNGCAPSVLNGFNPVSFIATIAAFGALGFFEFNTSLRRVDDKELGAIHTQDMQDAWKWGVAGDYNFDPLGLYSSVGDDAYARKGLRELEISHGRSAMLGITSFAAWEKLTGHPIVESSMFFHPNAMLPALVAAYVAFNQFYEFDDNSDTYLRFKLSSEGEARFENLKLSLPKQSEDSLDVLEMADKAGAFFSTLGEKYEQLQNAYVENVVKIEKDEKN